MILLSMLNKPKLVIVKNLHVTDNNHTVLHAIIGIYKYLNANGTPLLSNWILKQLIAYIKGF